MLVIAPAVPDSPVGFEAVGGVNTIRFGVLKFARFSRLKISARNCSCSRSLIAVSFNTEKSHGAKSRSHECVASRVAITSRWPKAAQ
jgi:hypothetical protein